MSVGIDHTENKGLAVKVRDHSAGRLADIGASFKEELNLDTARARRITTTARIHVLFTEAKAGRCDGEIYYRHH